MSEPADRWRERGLRDAVLAGDASAWEHLLTETFPTVIAYVRWRCGGLADLADDVSQETWLTAARRLSAFDPAKGSFTAWVCGIAANVIRNQLRTRLRQRTRPLAHAPEPVAPRDDGRSACVAGALAQLPERYERVLRAKYLEQRSVAVVAAEWGESEKAIESLLTRARQAFREAFEKLAEDMG